MVLNMMSNSDSEKKYIFTRSNLILNFLKVKIFQQKSNSIQLRLFFNNFCSRLPPLLVVLLKHRHISLVFRFEITTTKKKQKFMDFFFFFQVSKLLIKIIL